METNSSLSQGLALVCPACDSYNAAGTSNCIVCATALLGQGETQALTPIKPPAWMSAPAGTPIPTGEVAKIDLGVLSQAGGEIQPPSSGPVAKPMRCSSCDEPHELQDRFCRNCGNNLAAQRSPKTQAHARPEMSAAAPSASVTPEAPSTLFFGAVAVAQQVRLILVKGQNNQLGQWKLAAGETTLGRNAMVSFSSDKTLAPTHCVIENSNEGIVVRPINEVHGVYVSIRAPIRLEQNDEFVVGNQRLRLVSQHERELVINGNPNTATFGSMMPGPPALCIERRIAGSALTERYARSQRMLTFGRSQCDVNFPNDPYISGRHAQVTMTDSEVVLQDIGSRNGTYSRVKKSHLLLHGDALMLGEQVLRVEITNG